MTKKLLIDAHQPEETRVVLLNGNKIEEFDYENNNNKQLKGNVYLAKVTRVEPSLQAAFVEYGGNRQGFLAFSEIHPDYYRIPIEDREALEAEEENASSDDDEPQDEDGNGPVTLDGEDDTGQRKSNQAAMRRYKIQEVITRKQILLVQVVKEERGNKGAALTTYLSLAGRYCVLMPNSNRGGGVSRKITNVADRKRLKSVVSELEVPKGMAVIVRTAGSKRTKTEIKRDYSYLSKLWDEIRSKTLQSEAPSLINEEGSLVKRAIRDIYTNDVEEVLIEGEESYKVAKTHMKMLIPSHAKRVVKHAGGAHLFQAHKVEPQLDSIHHNEVVLKSGGYLVINQTEALVAIDVNSGKATRERNIEETALKTNMEAADEVGRQLRLRDLSGLIVIDFIDMEETRNQHAVERRLKEALRNDRARIQVGSISHFGLMEMSRQRLRPSLVESVSQSCSLCEGTGRVRSVNSSALQILRIIEDEASNRSGSEITLYVQSAIALYILNQKRASLAEIEQQFNCQIMLMADETLMAPDYRIEVDGNSVSPQQRSNNNNSNNNNQRPERNKTRSAEPSHPVDEPEIAADDDEQPKKRRRGRRGGRRRKKRSGEDAAVETQDQALAPNGSDVGTVDEKETAAPSEDGEKPKRRRRRRGGRNSETSENQTNAAHEQAGAQNADANSSDANSSDASSSDTTGQNTSETANTADSQNVAEKTPRRAAKKKAVAKKAGAKKTAAKTTEDTKEVADKAGAKKPAAKKGRKKKAAPSGEANSPVVQEKSATSSSSRQPISSAEVDVVDVSSATGETKKRGWWSR